MSDQNLKEKLKQARVLLLKAGISPKYVARTSSELQAHYADLKDKHLQEGMSLTEAEALAENQLGDIKGIAEETAAKKELKSFISLHPKLTLFVVPVLGFIFSFFLCIAVIILTADISGMNSLPDGEPVPASAIAIFNLTGNFYVYLLPVLLAAGFVFLATQRLFQRKLLMLSLLLISIMGTLVNYSITGSVIGESSVSLSLSIFGFSPPFAFNTDYFLGSLIRLAFTFSISYLIWQKLSTKESLQI